VATAEAVALTGARPVFVDIDAQSYCLDPAEVKGAITERTKAIIPVHLYGLTADMDPIMDLARDSGLLVIEDAAQAHGAEYAGRKAGALGDMACFSFYGSKNMTTGEGGMITTNSREFADALGLIRNHGEEKYYQSVVLGHNYRMPEVAAAIGCEQLLKLPRFLTDRRRNAKTLLDAFAGLNEVQLPLIPVGYASAWYVFTLRVRGANAAKRNKVLSSIRERRVGAQVYYPKPIHKMPFYQNSFGRTRLPQTETAARQVISLPVHPSLSENDVTRVVAAVKDAVT
jgi:perosamine synthetase